MTEVVHLRPELLDVPWSALLVAMCALFLGGQFVYCTPSRLEVDVLKCAIIP